VRPDASSQGGFLIFANSEEEMVNGDVTYHNSGFALEKADDDVSIFAECKGSRRQLQPLVSWSGARCFGQL